MTELLHPTSAALVPLRAGAWLCKRLQLDAEDRLSVRFEVPEEAVSFDLDLAKATPGRPASAGLRATVLSVRGRLQAASQARQQEASALVRGIAAAVDARVHRQPAGTLAEALGRDPTPRQVRFSRALVLQMLGPEWAPGVPLPGGWALHDVFPASQLRQSERLTLAVEVRHTDGRRMVLLVGPRDNRQVLSKTAHFDLEHLTLGTTPGADGSALLTLLCFALQLHDHDALRVEFPTVAEDTAALPAPTPERDTPGRAVNLAINADCNQHCAFCSALAVLPPSDGGSQRLHALRVELRHGRQGGATRVRFNGYDPLAFSSIVPLMAEATALGFTEAEVWSPCTRLADPRFRAAVLEALPAATRFFVPLYGGSAARHDAYVGQPGAFAALSAAIAGLRAARGADCVRVTSVLTRRNLDELNAMQRQCRAWQVELNLHLPFPTTEGRDDAYFHEATSFADAAAALAQSWAQHRYRPEVAGMPPCVLHRSLRAHGARIRDWLSVETSRHQPAGAYRDDRYVHSGDGLGSQDTRVAPVVPCPHAGHCALALACSQSVLRAYAHHFGLADLHPVPLADVLLDG